MRSCVLEKIFLECHKMLLGVHNWAELETVHKNYQFTGIALVMRVFVSVLTQFNVACPKTV